MVSILVALTPAVGGPGVACDGVPDDEYAALLSERAALHVRIEELQAALASSHVRPVPSFPSVSLVDQDVILTRRCGGGYQESSSKEQTHLRTRIGELEAAITAWDDRYQSELLRNVTQLQAEIDELRRDNVQLRKSSSASPGASGSAKVSWNVENHIRECPVKDLL